MTSILALTLASASPAAPWAERGHNVTGRLGIRLGLVDAPLGIRYFWEDRYGAEGAVGFALGSDAATRVQLQGGFLYALAPGERVNFFLRPGLGFKSVDRDSTTVTTVSLSLSVEGEWFATEDLSLLGGMGVAVDSKSGEGGTETSLFTTSRAHAAVAYYFP